MQILDANAILRYLLKDIPDQHDQVEKAILNGAYATTEVLAEVAYILKGIYGINREDISWMIHCVLLDVETDNKQVMQYAMGVYNQSSLDFVDCILIAYQRLEHIDVFTFDKKLNAGLNRNFAVYTKEVED